MCFIYKIYNDEFVYFGKTMDYNSRISAHRSSFKRFKSGKSKAYCSSYKILESDNWKSEIIEECEDKFIMTERELYYIRNFDCVNLNGTHYRSHIKDAKIHSILQKEREDRLSLVEDRIWRKMSSIEGEWYKLRNMQI